MLVPAKHGAVRCSAQRFATVRSFLAIALVSLAFNLAIANAVGIPQDDTGAVRTPAALVQLASAREVYPDQAEETYLRLANVLGNGSPERLHALERGFSLSLRDGNLKQAADFADLLNAEGHSESLAMLGGKTTVHKDALVPGGLEALGAIAGVKPGTSSAQFFAEYARQVVTNVTCVNNCAGDRYTQSVQGYFGTVIELEALGKRDGDTVVIVLSVNGKEERNHTQSVLKVLGLQMRTEKGQLSLDRGESLSQGRKQDILTALGIDQVGIEEALRAGKPCGFSIHDEYAAIYPSARMWKDSFPKLDQSQFALMLLHNPTMVRLYVGITTLDRPTFDAVIGHSGLFWFTGHPADLLMQYGNAFAVEGAHAAVPGGAAARPVWSQMAGASADQPTAFYQALLNQKSSSLLAFFYALSNLDPRHQTFFTANLVRTKRFYALFATLPESQSLYGGSLHESSFSELLRSVPIDDEGHVVFPGSPQIWMVAKGNASDDLHVAKIMTKASVAATPDVEDEILLHLADTHYKSHLIKSSELDNFLAVAGIDAHRTKPLDEESALLLAQHYSDFWAAYPYFTDLTSIDASGFRSFFNVVDSVGHQTPLEKQLELGQLNSLIEWVVLVRRRHFIDDNEAARLFVLICTRLAGAGDEAMRTLASINLAREILTDCGHGTVGRWDDALRACLLGVSPDGITPRAKDYEVVLDDQKAPTLESVRLIVEAAGAALTPTGAAHPVVLTQVILPAVPLPKEVSVSGREKDAILLYDPGRAQKLIEEWNLNARSPQNGSSNQKLAGEILKAIEPQVTLALAAPVYAYFFRSADRVISDDPLLLRKHRYFDFVRDDKRGLVTDSQFITTSSGLGSYIQGGFSQFALASGYAAASGWKQGGLGGPDVIAEEVAVIRSATWEQLLNADQRLVTLRILAAREWIVGAAQNPALFASLSEDTSGLISLSRRANLLNGIEERDWQQVWASITLPDLFRLGGSYLRHYPAEAGASPVAVQLQTVAASNAGDHLDILGRIPNHVLGCAHPHLVSDAPYEEYERQISPTYIAERAAEFKLFLAFRADSLGVPPSDLSQAAETLAAKAFRSSQMVDYRDWRALLTAYASITSDNLKSALEQ